MLSPEYDYYGECGYTTYRSICIPAISTVYNESFVRAMFPPWDELPNAVKSAWIEAVKQANTV